MHSEPAGLEPPMSNCETLMTGASALARWARETPMAVAVMEGDTSYSYAMLFSNMLQAVEMLQAVGLRRGMIAGIQTEVQYLQLVLLLAAEIIGAAHLSITEPDLQAGGELAERCDLLCVETVTSHVAHHPNLVRLPASLVDDLALRGPAGGAAALLATPPPSDAIGRLGTTSGTTGQRKFIGYTYQTLRNIVWSVKYILNHDADRYNFISTYRFNLMSTYSDSMLALEFGKTIVYCGDIDFFTSLKSFPGCHTFLMSGDAARVSAEAARSGHRAASCSLRVIGGPVSPALRAALHLDFTAKVRSIYASNEASVISVTDGDDGTGTVLPDTSVKIVNENGREVSPGKPGIIHVRSPRMSTGYLWDDVRTADNFADGWFRTNDMGVIPSPGKLIVLGRADEMLNIGGLKISPHPIEARIRGLEGVTDAVLVNLANAIGIDELHVFIERRDPGEDETIGRELVRIMQRHVTGFTAHYATRLPRTQTGKVQRNLLRDLTGLPS